MPQRKRQEKGRAVDAAEIRAHHPQGPVHQRECRRGAGGRGCRLKAHAAARLAGHGRSRRAHLHPAARWAVSFGNLHALLRHLLADLRVPCHPAWLPFCSGMTSLSWFPHADKGSLWRAGSDGVAKSGMLAQIERGTFNLEAEMARLPEKVLSYNEHGCVMFPL